MAEIDYAQEQGMWRAIGACERACDDMEGDIERVRDDVERWLARERWIFALLLIAGFMAGSLVTGTGAERHVAAVKARAQFCMPRPYGIDPQPRGWERGV